MVGERGSRRRPSKQVSRWKAFTSFLNIKRGKKRAKKKSVSNLIKNLGGFMTESQLTRKIVNILKKEFSSEELWFYKSSDKFTSGIPDIIICYHGRFVGIEIKTEKGKLTRLQAHTIERIKNAGGLAYVCRSADEVRDNLFYILDKVQKGFF